MGQYGKNRKDNCVNKMKAWSKVWKSSKKIRKQRKYRYNAPLHVRRKFATSHLSKELRKKYNKRNITVIEGDKVKVVRGQFKGHSAKVQEVDIKKSKILLPGMEIQKKDGNKVQLRIDPSNVIIEELNLEDKKRNEILNRKKGENKKE